KGLSLTRWRGAEQIVTQILTAQGFIVEDVSRQNIGYDLRAVKAAASVCIEVKHVEAMGKPFILTMNEETVAREKRNQYAIAIIAQGDEGVSFGLVRDPVQTLKMDRQCRQWVWECSSYDIDAEFYTYSNEGK
ncbi:MAG: protein NO VEIN domain-containing protein, partial [Vulcanimicrobiaceae bacterium]